MSHHCTQQPAGPLPKPSLQALPGALVPLHEPVLLRCQGPPGADLYRLEKLRSRNYQDEAVLSIPAMQKSSAGSYRCSYQNGSVWSLPSDQVDLIATGVYAKPSLSAWPGPAVSSGGDVTLQCQSPYGFDQFALYKEGAAGPTKSLERWYRADFPIITVTAADSGTYRCYSFSRESPYLWSAPSDPLELVVTGTSAPPVQLPMEPLSSVSEFPETFRKLDISPMNKVSTTQTSQNTTIFREESGSTAGTDLQYYTRGNVIRICLGAVVLILLVGILAEDWHSRKMPPLHRVRAIQRPLPPLPQIQKPQGCQDGGRPDGHSHEYHHENFGGCHI
ncbi:platelet glycoprotein VI-like isoform X2 [Choloepus didactylus]|uniref:platelet glycoprotein VI-like isoform X2 n=1 Tax=Choloepus didactylus TaxID=27675 RepID=UPI00189E73B6|nr:platelet glycoprotein VI-like isoform X2 [Choloepus didactylus]